MDIDECRLTYAYKIFWLAEPQAHIIFAWTQTLAHLSVKILLASSA